MLGSSVHALIVRATIQKTGARGAQRDHVCTKTGLCTFRPCVRLSRVLRHLGIVGEDLVTVQ